MRVIFMVARCLARVHLLDKASVRHCYGTALTEAVRASMPGAPMRSRQEMKRLINRWRFWEKRYAAYGYCPISPVEIAYAFKKREYVMNSMQHCCRLSGEHPIFYATSYLDSYLLSSP